MCCPPVCLPNAQGLFRLLREFMVQLQPCREQYVQIRSDRQPPQRAKAAPRRGRKNKRPRHRRVATGRVNSSLSCGCKATFARGGCMCTEMGEALVRRHTRCRRVRHRELFDWSSGSQVPAQLLVYAGSTASLCRDGIRQDSAYGWLWLLRFILVALAISPQLIHMLILAWYRS